MSEPINPTDGAQPRDSAASSLEALFEKAKQEGGFEYLYVLVRIDGIQCYQGYKDELVELRGWLNQPHDDDLIEAYRFLASQPQPLELLGNLLNCANGKHYQVRTFLHLVKGQFPTAVWPATSEKIHSLVTEAKASGFPDLADQISASYPANLLDGQEKNPEAFRGPFANLSQLLRRLLEIYFAKRLNFRNGEKYIKIPNSLDVLELLTDDEFGLFGLRVHFSNNCTADFQRTSHGVFGSNVEFGPPVTFLIMSLDPSSNEYRVNGKRLYEIGLPGRYNKLGEWKPLIYPGNPDHLVKEVAHLSNDPDVQGVLLYLRLTGHRCVEFALRTNLELPGPYTATREGGLHIWKCPIEEHNPTDKNTCVYDCWLELKTGDVEEIEKGLSSIGHLISILCFPYGASYSWRNKYRTTVPETRKLTPTHEELKIVDHVLQTFPYTPDGVLLASAIDWYNRGTISSNVFTKFLCYYVALESVAVAIADGADLGKTAITKPTKAEKQAATITCINDKQRELFDADPVRFVTESYFQCVQSLTAKTRLAVKAVFGDAHPYLRPLFESFPDGDISLSKIRSALAHGGVSLLDKQHEHLVRKHLHEMERITKEFLLRVLFRLEASDKVPSWSGTFQMSFVTADPRTTLFSSTESIFPKPVDWRIRAEWCE
jgi:hypothetical protein